MPEPVHFPDAWGAAVEKWIEAEIRGNSLEPQMIVLRNALPALFNLFVAELFLKPSEKTVSDG